jgi:hypothetical protein
VEPQRTLKKMRRIKAIRNPEIKMKRMAKIRG